MLGTQTLTPKLTIRKQTMQSHINKNVKHFYCKITSGIFHSQNRALYFSNKSSRTHSSTPGCLIPIHQQRSNKTQHSPQARLQLYFLLKIGYCTRLQNLIAVRRMKLILLTDISSANSYYIQEPVLIYT